MVGTAVCENSAQPMTVSKFSFVCNWDFGLGFQSRTPVKLVVTFSERTLPEEPVLRFRFRFREELAGITQTDSSRSLPLSNFTVIDL